MPLSTIRKVFLIERRILEILSMLFTLDMVIKINKTTT